MTHVLEASPLWPAALDHIRYNSPHPARLTDFYVRAMGMSATKLGVSEFLLEAPSRSLVIGTGDVAGQPYSAFALSDDDHLGRYRAFLTSRHAELLPSPTALFDRNAFAVRDPDGRLAVFGRRTRPRKPSAGGLAAGNLAGELQHVVVASARFAAMMEFYTDTLGFMISDTVAQDPEAHAGEVNVCFLRADERHHSFAIFRAPQSHPDHHAYETTGWNDLKLWADHFASLEIPIWWGPGRHGAGNNLFFMIKDPDGNNIEISAELEIMKKGQPGKKWQGAKHAINLWGDAWIRDTGGKAQH